MRGRVFARNGNDALDAVCLVVEVIVVLDTADCRVSLVSIVSSLPALASPKSDLTSSPRIAIVLRRYTLLPRKVLANVQCKSEVRYTRRRVLYLMHRVRPAQLFEVEGFPIYPYVRAIECDG